MSHQKSSTVVNAGIAHVEEMLRDVQGWSRFLNGVESVEALGGHHYRLTLRRAGRSKVIDVTVKRHADGRTVHWKALGSHQYCGDITLTPISERRTDVTMSVTWRPQSLAEGMAELLGEGSADAALALQRIDRSVREALAVAQTMPVQQLAATA
ncbi:MAG: SRPBCC family protein [Kineosporiaceae bacterium]